MSNGYFIRKSAICGFREIAEKTATYVAVKADEGVWFKMNDTSALSLKLPNDTTGELEVTTKFLISKEGTGDVTIIADTGANVLGDSTHIGNQYDVRTAIKEASDTWRVY